MSSMVQNANQIDQLKIERLLGLFNNMQKSDNIMHIIMLTMKELRSLIISQSVAVFVLNDDYAKAITTIEETSHGGLFH